MAPVHSAHTNPPGVTPRYLQAEWREAAFFSVFFFLPPVKSLSSPLMGGGGEFEITLAVKDGDRQDKQETPDSRDF